VSNTPYNCKGCLTPTGDANCRWYESLASCVAIVSVRPIFLHAVLVPKGFAEHPSSYGRDPSKSAIVNLNAPNGKSRLRLVVDSLGAARIEFLDEAGRVTNAVTGTRSSAPR
jgi:hypothetical protein